MRTASLLSLALIIACNGPDTDTDTDMVETDTDTDTDSDTDTDTDTDTDALPTVAAASDEGPAGESIDIAVTLTDEDVDTVTLDVSSDDTALFPAGSLVVSGTGADRTIAASPAAGVTGMATLTLTATDAASQTGDTTIELDIYVNRSFTGAVLKDSGFTGDHLHSVDTDAAGNVYTCGYVNLGASGTTHADKTGLDGTVAWTNNETAAIGNIGRRCRVNAAGQLAIASQLKATGGDNSQSLGLYTYQTDGTEYFAPKVFKFGGVDSYGTQAAIADDGSVYVLADTLSGGSVHLVKYASNGNEEWSKTVVTGGTSNRAANFMVASDGSVWVVGFGSGTLTDSDAGTHVTQDVDGYIAVYSSAGALTGFEMISSTGPDYLADIVEGDDGVYICGTTQGTLGAALVSSQDWVVQKRTDISTVAWTTQGGETSGNNACIGIDLGHDGTVYAVGYANYVDGTNAQSHITSLTAAGVVNYSKIGGTPGTFTSAASVSYSGRDLLVAGTTDAEIGGLTPTNGKDGFLIVADPVDGSIR